MMTVLVSAASKHGATYEIAERIAAELTRNGVAAVAVPLEDVASLEGYDAVVLGSGIYAGRWLEPAKRFVDRHLDGLRDRPVWLFSSGPIGDPPKPAEDPADAAPMRERTRAREHRVIAGLVDRSRLNFAERAITRVVGAADGDFRPWSEIDAWARNIADQLGAPAGR
jgi:menaquinone-dependent protoporphyrinogen oxidase